MKVEQMTTSTFWKGEAGVKGLVDDQGKLYKASLSIKGSRIYDYSCSCDQGDCRRTMCPHCQALYQAYQERAKRQKGEPVVTSQEARTMIREYTNREVATIVGAAVEGGVRLFAHLIVEQDGILLEFSLGRERLYVLKDLAAFAKAMEQGAFVEYGKELAFPHCLSAFEENSRPLVEFAMELVFVYCSHYEQLRGRGFASPTLRRLHLSSGSRDRFFLLMKRRELELQEAGGSKRLVTVVEENPEFAVTVRKKGRDGVAVSLEPGISVIRGERRIYVAAGMRIFCCDEVCGAALGIFLEQLTGKAKGSELFVNETDMPLFYERVLKRIAAYCTIDSGGLVLESYKPEELKARFEFDCAGPFEVIVKPTLSYGDYSFQPVEDERLPRTVCRDVPGEFKISRLISKYFKYKVHDTRFPAIKDDEAAIYRLLTEGMEEFMATGEVWLSEAFEKLKAIPMPKVSVGVRSDGGWLELTVDMAGMTGKELSGLLTGYRQKKRYHRLKTGEFLALDDQGLMTVAKLLEDLGASRPVLSNHSIRLPRYRALYLNEILKEGKGVSLYRDALFKAVVRGMKSVEDSDFEILPPMLSVLREYQKTGFRWLKTLDSYGFGGILADEMGLGKTLQVIALLLDEAGRQTNGPSLIVCPASLIYNWENEIRTFAPSLPVKTITGTFEERKELLAGASQDEVLITSYDLLKRDITLYGGLAFRFQIIDEAQFIKNPLTQSARAVKAVTAASRFALTGTPVENRLSELWSIFDYLMPGFLFGYSKFKKEYELPVVRDGDEEALNRLHRMTGPFILRRMKKEVLKELPDKLETVIYSGFDKEQKELYTANAWQLKEQLLKEKGTPHTVELLGKLMRLRQICCDPRLCYEDYKGGSAKLETCMDLVKTGVEGGHRMLLFSQFTSMLDILGKRLQKEGVDYYRLTGDTPARERIHMVNSFQEGGVPVFLISLRAGGTGLNLMAADTVIHYDPWWNAAVQNQATDRVHRLGQVRQVTVWKLIARNTIEENILKLQEAKKNLADRVVTEGGISFHSLTKEDIIGLL